MLGFSAAGYYSTLISGGKKQDKIVFSWSHHGEICALPQVKHSRKQRYPLGGAGSSIVYGTTVPDLFMF